MPCPLSGWSSRHRLLFFVLLLDMSSTAPKGDTEILEPSRAQAQLARRVAESRATVPDLTLVAEADLGARTEAVLDLAIFATARALRAFPPANGAYRDGRFERYARVNVAFTVETADAVVAPTVFDADEKSLEQIAAETADLGARAAQLTAPAFAGATATVTALDARRVIPPLPLGQAITVGIGAAQPRALVVDGAVTVRRACDVTLVADHRIVHGTLAADVLAAIVAALQQA